MKKILSLIFLGAISLPSLAYAPPAVMTNVHDMQMIKEQRFRMEEINEYKEVKEEKERYRRKIEGQKPQINAEPTIIKAPQMIDEGGQIKIRYEN